VKPAREATLTDKLASGQAVSATRVPAIVARSQLGFRRFRASRRPRCHPEETRDCLGSTTAPTSAGTRRPRGRRGGSACPGGIVSNTSWRRGAERGSPPALRAERGMQFWDTSALIPLVVRQPSFSEQCRLIFRRRAPRGDRVRQPGRMPVGDRAPRARRHPRPSVASTVCDEDRPPFRRIRPGGLLARRRACGLALLGRHPLRSLDALQLACALTLGPGGSGEASVRATIAGGYCYCVRFGGPAGGRVTSAPGVLRIVGPRVEAGCL
jgi:hypothetical protein